VQRLLADGYGLEAEGDCRTAVSCTPAAIRGGGQSAARFAHGEPPRWWTSIRLQRVEPQPGRARETALQPPVSGDAVHERARPTPVRAATPLTMFPPDTDPLTAEYKIPPAGNRRRWRPVLGGWYESSRRRSGLPMDAPNVKAPSAE